MIQFQKAKGRKSLQEQWDSSPWKVLIMTHDVLGGELVQALLERASGILARSLPAESCQLDHYQAESLEKHVLSLFQREEAHCFLVLPWDIPLSPAHLIEVMKTALKTTTGQDVESHCQDVPRQYAQGGSSLGPWDGVRNPAAALDRLMAISPGWHWQVTRLRAGGRQVVMPCPQEGETGGARPESQHVPVLTQSLMAVLLPHDSVTLPLRHDGELTASYLSRFLCDLVMLLASPTKPVA
jgi:hypothetical protein